MTLSAILKWLLYGVLGITLAMAVPRERDRQHLDSNVRNILANPGFENRSADWDASGSSTLFISSTEAFGNLAANWDPSATGEFLTSTAALVPDGLEAEGLCLAKALYRWTGGVVGEIEFQVFDGTSIIATIPFQPSTIWRQIIALYPCTTGGSVSMRLASTADAATIEFDSTYLGINYLSTEIGASGVVAAGFFEHAASCKWENAGTTVDAFPVDVGSDCVVMTSVSEEGGVSIDLTNTQLPEINLINLSPGNYVVTATFMALGSAGASRPTFALNDGTDTRGHAAIRPADAGEGSVVTMVANFKYTTTQATKTFALFSSTTAGSAQIDLSGGAGDTSRLNFQVIRYPLETQSAITLSTQGWNVNANIGGAIVDLGAGDQATYTGMTNGGLTLTTNAGSQPVFQACATTEEGVASTCSGDESVGFATSIPYAGLYSVCMTFNHNKADGGIIATVFQIVETGNANQTILKEGMGRPTSGEGATSVDITAPVYVCGEFNFDSAGKKTIRLFYEQEGDGTIDTSALILDEDPNRGQQDLHIFMYPLSQGFPMSIITTESTITPGVVNPRFGSARVDGSASCVVSNVKGNIAGPSWISFGTHPATGKCQMDILAGYFQNDPNCQVTAVGASGTGPEVCRVGVLATTTSVETLCFTSTTAADADNAFNIECHGD